MLNEELSARVGRIEDRVAILNLEGLYARLYDSRDAPAWALLFTQDGIYQGRRLSNMPEQNFVQGRDALARFCASEPASGIHSMHVPELVIHDSDATGRIHFQFSGSYTDVDSRHHSRSVTGYYDVRYVRSGSEWLIARRVTTYLESTQRIVYPYEPTPFDLTEPVASDARHDARR